MNGASFTGVSEENVGYYAHILDMDIRRVRRMGMWRVRVGNGGVTAGARQANSIRKRGPSGTKGLGLDLPSGGWASRR